MEIVLFTIVGISLYFTTDWVLRLIEQRRGAPLPNRSLVFFGIILILAIVSFEFIERILAGGSPI
jgi:hypothetical protein